MPKDRKFRSIAAQCGDGLRPELTALFKRLAIEPTELFERPDGMTQSGPDPKSESQAEPEFLRKLCKSP